MLLALIWLGAWLGTAWKLARLDGAVTLGMVWFVLLLVPSSVLVLLNLGEPMAEHRVYLAAAGFFLASGPSSVTCGRFSTRERPAAGCCCDSRWPPGSPCSAG